MILFLFWDWKKESPHWWILVLAQAVALGRWRTLHIYLLSLFRALLWFLILISEGYYGLVHEFIYIQDNRSLSPNYFIALSSLTILRLHSNDFVNLNTPSFNNSFKIPQSHWFEKFISIKSPSDYRGFSNTAAPRGNPQQLRAVDSLNYSFQQNKPPPLTMADVLLPQRRLH